MPRPALPSVTRPWAASTIPGKPGRRSKCPFLIRLKLHMGNCRICLHRFNWRLHPGVNLCSAIGMHPPCPPETWRVHVCCSEKVLKRVVLSVPQQNKYFLRRHRDRCVRPRPGHNPGAVRRHPVPLRRVQGPGRDCRSGPEQSYTDAATVGEYAEDAMSWAVRTNSSRHRFSPLAFNGKTCYNALKEQL